MANLSYTVLCLRIRPGAYSRIEHLAWAALEWAQALPAKIRPCWKGLPRMTTLSLVNYGHKKGPTPRAVANFIKPFIGHIFRIFEVS